MTCALIAAHGRQPIVLDTAILGAGQGGTLTFASLQDLSGAVPGVDLSEIPKVINIAPQGSMFANHGDFKIGQTPRDNHAGTHARQPGEFTPDHGAYTRASDYVRSLTMTGYDAGMVTYRAPVTDVETRPPGGWGNETPPNATDMPLRFTAGGHTFYARRLISAGGLGRPVPLGKEGTPLGAHEPKLRAAGKVVDAQASLQLPGGSNGRVVVVVGNGPTGAWACEAAINSGAAKVYWAGRLPDKPFGVPEIREQLSQLGLTPAQIDTFAGAYNDRNGALFRHIESGRIELRERGLEDAELDETTQRVRATFVGAQGAIDVDGVVSATGQMIDLPKGIDKERMEFRMVTVEYQGKMRLVALDAYDRRDGTPLGIRIKGAQMAKAATLVRKDELEAFQGLLVTQSRDPSVPEDAQGVPGSIYQTNIDVPLANQSAPLKGGAVK